MQAPLPIRLTLSLVAAVTVALATAPPALGANGVGLAGPSTDKTITFFCFGVIAFFGILVIVLSFVQGALEKRKERRSQRFQRV